MTSLKAKLALVAFLVAGVIGVVVWDRKSAVHPKNSSLAKAPDSAPADTALATGGGVDFPTTTASPPSFGEAPYTPPTSTPASTTDNSMTVNIGGNNPLEHPTGAVETVPPTGDISGSPYGTGYPAQTPPTTGPAGTGWDTGPVSTPTIPAQSAAPIPAQSYTVKSGDCLQTISQAVYGKGKYWRKILEANKAQLADEESILKVGMVLKVPALDIAPAPVAPTEPPASPGLRTYQIQPGDTFEAIAEKLYGTARACSILVEANKDRAPDPNRLRIGQTIVVPEYSAEPAVHEVPAAEQDSASFGAGERVYTVKDGDNLSSISEEFYGSSNQFSRIFEANKSRMSSPDRLRVGMKLVIPPAESGAVR